MIIYKDFFNYLMKNHNDYGFKKLLFILALLELSELYAYGQRGHIIPGIDVECGDSGSSDFGFGDLISSLIIMALIFIGVYIYGSIKNDHKDSCCNNTTQNQHKKETETKQNISMHHMMYKSYTLDFMGCIKTEECKSGYFTDLWTLEEFIKKADSVKIFERKPKKDDGKKDVLKLQPVYNSKPFTCICLTINGKNNLFDLPYSQEEIKANIEKFFIVYSGGYICPYKLIERIY